MEYVTIKEFAKDQHVSYQAIHSQISRYREELQEHIIKNGRIQLLDEYAVNFLKSRRRESPVIMVKQEQGEELKALKQQVEIITEQLLAAQAKIIVLQDENKTLLTAQAKNEYLLSDLESTKDKLKEKETELERFTPSIFGFYRKKR
jgi:hypothetical protein